jgi:hypothetical protein
MIKLIYNVCPFSSTAFDNSFGIFKLFINEAQDYGVFTLEVKVNQIYYTLHFYFRYLSLLAQPVTIFVYEPIVYGPARYLHYIR